MNVSSTTIKTIKGGTLRQRIPDDLIVELEEIAVNVLKDEYRYEFDAIGGDKAMSTSEKIHKQREAMLIFVGGIFLVKLFAATV